MEIFCLAVVYSLLLLVTPPHGCRALLLHLQQPYYNASSISILYKIGGFPFWLSPYAFIQKRKPLETVDSFGSIPPKTPLHLSFTLNHNGIYSRERRCRACGGAFPVCGDNILRCERYSDITVLSTLTPLESERMLLLPWIQKASCHPRFTHCSKLSSTKFLQSKIYRNTAKMSLAKQEMPLSLKTSVENSKAEYVRLGKSGLRISIPIFGAMSIGHPDWAPWVIGEEEVILSNFPIPV